MKRRTYVLWKKILTRTIIGGIIIGACYLYFRTQAFTIYNYELIGVPESYQHELDAKLHELASAPLYKVLPANRVLSYHKDRIIALFVNTLPNTQSVTITATSLHTLRITITPQIPLFKVDATHAVTKDGVIYKELQSLETYPTFISASSTMSTSTQNGILFTRLTIPQATSTEELFSRIAELLPKINIALFPVAIVSVDAYGDITLSDSKGKSVVRLSTHADFAKAWSTVISAVDTEPLKSLLVTKKDRLEYIDARYGNKVFYRFTNTALPTIINASTTYVDTTSATTTAH